MASKGERISVGNITDSTGVAIGHQAQAHVTQGSSVADVAQLFASVYERIESRPSDPNVDKDEVKDTVHKLEAEVAKGEQTNTAKAERWLRTLGLMAPDILDVTLAALTGPQAVVSAAVKKIAQKAKEAPKP